MNGFVFDEIPAPVVVAAAEQARAAGAAVFFDPGAQRGVIHLGCRHNPSSICPGWLAGMW